MPPVEIQAETPSEPTARLEGEVKVEVAEKEAAPSENSPSVENQPVSDPEPEQSTAPKVEEPGFFGKIANSVTSVFKGDSKPSGQDIQNSEQDTSATPEEPQEQAAASQAVAEKEVAAIATLEPQPLVETKQTKATTEVAAIAPPGKNENKPAAQSLRHLKLTLGGRLSTGQVLDEKTKKSRACFKKGTIKALFCTIDARWPGELKAVLVKDSLLYQGEKILVRYDNNKSSRLYLLFQSSKVQKVLDHYVGLFGPPTEIKDGQIRLYRGKPLLNRSFRWKAMDDSTGKIKNLEIRNYDDIRETIPDTKYGVIRLYDEGSESIFKHLSEVDFILRM